MIEFLLTPEALPFTSALVVMLLIGVIEVLGLGAAMAHVDLGGHAGVEGGNLLGWLGIGRVPLLMLLVLLLSLFGLIGLGIQLLASGVAGSPLSPWIAAPAAFAGSLPLLGVSARALAAVMPGDETTAVSLESLIGRRAVVTVGAARRGSPARAQVRDVHGQSHFVMIEPNDDGQTIAAGESALLVRREGEIFIGLSEGSALLPRLDD